MKEIKTKQTLKDIKALDKTADMSRRMKNAYIRTKDQAEHLGHDDNGNYVDDAGNSIREGAEIVIQQTGHTAGNYGKKALKKIKNRRAPDADAPRYHDSNGENVRQTPTSEVKETAHRDVVQTKTKLATELKTTSIKAKEAVNQNVSQPGVKQAAKHNAIPSRAKETIKRKVTLSRPSELAKRRFVLSRVKQRFSQTIEIRLANQNIGQIQSQQISERIPAQRPLFQPARKAAAQTLHTSGKTGRTIKQSVETGGKTLKEAAKGTIKATQRSVKTAVKTAQAAQRAAQTTRLAAKAASVSAKTAVKAMLAAIKAIIAAAKGLTALIAAGGWIAVTIILVICLAGLLLGSAFGIFYSNESPGGNTPVMSEMVNQLNNEFAAKIEQIENENPHDTLELSGSNSISASQWREILAVYAVKVTVDPENGMDVATLDDAKVGILRDVFWDMNKIDYWIETIVHEETVTTTDEDGNETTETITTTETILHINVKSKSHTDMIAEYGFNTQQVKMLNELMQDEYQQLFIRLIGS
ncbi:hypothetical protein [Lutispora sp.]|uniref:hypothetical protein n=1 Tax=Lutispora sp. TaxID=2828727 RepID=UPI002B21EAAC|nr:hypothetical protein [Lutispora sp.]MEA4961220.1 hypothetical protein [Lutispora sp.]